MGFQLLSQFARIMQLEAEESSANEKLAEASQTQNAKAIAELSVSAKKVKTEIDSCFARLEEAVAEHDKLSRIRRAKRNKCETSARQKNRLNNR